MPALIRPAPPERMDVLTDVVARAFADDPMILWPMADAPDMHARIVRQFAAIYGPLMDRGTLWEADDGDGFANWIPPGSAADELETTDALVAALAPLTDDGGARYEALWSWVVARVPEDLWYLDMIGVAPASQGRGIGTALIRWGLDRASEDGADAFLETAVARNVAYYERFGFRVVDEGEPVADGPHIWFMRTGS